MSPVYRVCHRHRGKLFQGRCPDCALEGNTRRAAKRAKFGYRRPHWQAVRRARLAMARGICELRIKCDGAPATHVHLAPELGGNHDAATLEDCRACCIYCSGAVDGARAHGRTPLTAWD